jgi:hypothetical protein
MRWGGRAAMRSPAEIVDSEYIGVRIPSPPLNYFKQIVRGNGFTWYRFPSMLDHRLRKLFF